MTKIFNVTFRWNETSNTYCSNVAIAESEEDVRNHYSEYPEVFISVGSEYDLEDAKRRMKPVVECEHIEEVEEIEESSMNESEKFLDVLENYISNKENSAWSRGVSEYIDELLENLGESIEYSKKLPENSQELKEILLNGASDWKQFSWGGCSLIYDSDIAERLCCPSELKKTRNGERKPNRNEEWLDVQARALCQASKKILWAFRNMKRFEEKKGGC